jgi:hypothetical protein
MNNIDYPQDEQSSIDEETGNVTQDQTCCHSDQNITLVEEEQRDLHAAILCRS